MLIRCLSPIPIMRALTSGGSLIIITLPSAALPCAALPSAALPSAALPSAALPSDALPSDALPSAPLTLCSASALHPLTLCSAPLSAFIHYGLF